LEHNFLTATETSEIHTAVSDNDNRSLATMTVDYLAYITTNCHRHHCRQLSNSSVNHTSHLAKQQAVRPAVRPPQYAPPPASGYLNNHTEWVGDLDLWPFDLRIGGEYQPWHGQPSRQFWLLRFFVVDLL